MTDALKYGLSAIIMTYQAVKRDFFPTPAKPHYTFNVGDITKVGTEITLMYHFSQCKEYAQKSYSEI